MNILVSNFVVLCVENIFANASFTQLAQILSGLNFTVNLVRFSNFSTTCGTIGGIPRGDDAA